MDLVWVIFWMTLEDFVFAFVFPYEEGYFFARGGRRLTRRCIVSILLDA